MFLHYWGVGPAEELARGVKAALDAQNSLKTRPGHDGHPARAGGQCIERR